MIDDQITNTAFPAHISLSQKGHFLALQVSEHQVQMWIEPPQNGFMCLALPKVYSDTDILCRWIERLMTKITARLQTKKVIILSWMGSHVPGNTHPVGPLCALILAIEAITTANFCSTRIKSGSNKGSFPSAIAISRSFACVRNSSAPTVPANPLSVCASRRASSRSLLCKAARIAVTSWLWSA